jgi:hypothetical protein
MSFVSILYNISGIWYSTGIRTVIIIIRKLKIGSLESQYHFISDNILIFKHSAAAKTNNAVYYYNSVLFLMGMGMGGGMSWYVASKVHCTVYVQYYCRLPPCS